MKIILIILIIFTAAHATDKTKISRSVEEAKVLIQDSVKNVIPQGQSEKILFKTHAGVYYLRLDSKHYQSIKGALELSQKSGESVQVKVDPDSMEIEEIVLSNKKQ